MKNKYLILGLVVVIGIGSFLFLSGKKNKQVADRDLAKVDPGEVQILPESFDLGRIVMKGGLVTKEYEIKNNSKNILRLKKIATSCMCTQASVVVGEDKTRFYGMEMQGDLNPRISFDIPGETTAKILVRFDPAAHGIQGVGLFDRSVWLTFADPLGTREVKFNGEVVLQ